ASPDRTAIPSRAAVVPTRDLGLLDGCLDALLTQESPLDEVVIVDDTAEGSLTLDRPGVTVLRSGGRGPYAARNVGWKHTGADLCWRILGDRDRQFAVVSEVLMEWVPRNRLIDLLEQYYRYGRSEHALRAMWEDDGAPQRPPLRARRLASQSAMLTSKLAAAL